MEQIISYIEAMLDYDFSKDDFPDLFLSHPVLKHDRSQCNKQSHGLQHYAKPMQKASD